MNKKEILKKVIENNGGIAKTSDFAANGINKYEVAAFCKEGFIERVRRGFYQLPQSNGITEELFIHKLLPQGIICVKNLANLSKYAKEMKLYTKVMNVMEVADIAASVLARLKNKAKKVEEAIRFACSSSVKRSFYVVWKSPNMLRTSY